mmetsp:Transcript_15912/g.39009  ORF Transcript_15912/g.39009 Transcript_15912/m.39009 type:complete len:398 (+) Transcript_15912:396-1589(+)
MLLLLLFVCCILGTAIWTILATDGAIITPILRRVGVDKISMGLTLFICVFIEDIPQIILTLLIEDYYDDSRDLSNVALVSVIAGLYDIAIKLAEAFDERSDIIETGIWCKESLWAHKMAVMAVVPIPIHEEDEDEEGQESSLFRANQSLVHVKSYTGSDRSNKTIVNQATEVVTETKLPRLKFVSGSLDRTVRIWDTEACVAGHKRDKCITTMRGHTKGVTCLEFLGNCSHHRERPSGGELNKTTFVLTGSKDGSVKLWNMVGSYVRTYFPLDGIVSTVTSIAAISKKELFVCSYENGIVRCWETKTGSCQAVYRGHRLPVNAVCSMENSLSFLSASDDCTIRLWNAMSHQSSEMSSAAEDSPSSDKRVDKVSLKTFIGHGDAVLALACASNQRLLS